MLLATQKLIGRVIADFEKKIADSTLVLEAYQGGTMRSFVGHQDSTLESIMWLEAAMSSWRDGIDALRQAQTEIPNERNLTAPSREALGAPRVRWGRVKG